MDVDDDVMETEFNRDAEEFAREQLAVLESLAAGSAQVFFEYIQPFSVVGVVAIASYRAHRAVRSAGS
jgi:hypothetical protein